MKKLTTLALGACMVTAFASAGFAASMSSMTSSEKTQWQKCEGMSESAMKADKDCTALMQKYPDAAKGTTGSSSGMSGSSSSGMSGSSTSGGMKK